MSGFVIFGAFVGAVAVLLTGVLSSEYLGYALSAFAVLLCITVSALRPVKLACAFLIVSLLTHTLKRAIFLVGEPSKGSYYSLVAAPLCVAVTLLFILFASKARTRVPGSAFALLGFMLIAALTTVLRSIQSFQFGAAAALFEYIVPALLYFVGLYLPDSAIGPLSRTAVRLGFASVAYGCWQFVAGPTVVDLTWAERAQSLSVQAVTVFQSLGRAGGLVSGDLFRPYSFHSDPFAWALSLATMVSLAGMTMPRRGVRFGLLSKSLVIALIGLPLCLSRSPIFGFLAMIFFYVAFRERYIKSPGLWVLMLAITGLVAVSASQFVVERFGFRDSGDASIESRYLTVGTLRARTGAGQFLADALREYPVVGAGLSKSAAGESRDGTAYDESDIAWSHNIVVDLLYTSGGLGAICFFGFLYLFARETLTMCRRRIQDPAAFRVGCWTLGAAGGFIVTGFASGAAFLNYDFFLILGLGAGWAARRQFADSRVLAQVRPSRAEIGRLAINAGSAKYVN